MLNPSTDTNRIKNLVRSILGLDEAESDKWKLFRMLQGNQEKN